MKGLNGFYGKLVRLIKVEKGGSTKGVDTIRVIGVDTVLGKGGHAYIRMKGQTDQGSRIQEYMELEIFAL